MVFSHHRDLECGGNAAALALLATDSSRGTSPRFNRSAESQSAAAGGALQMAFKKMIHHLLVYKGVVIRPGHPAKRDRDVRRAIRFRFSGYLGLMTRATIFL